MILGIDIGTRNTGIAYFEEECIFSVTLKQKNNRTGKKALFEMAELVVNKVKSLKPEIIGFESYGYKSGFVNTDLGELVGIVLYLLRKEKLEFLFLSPKTVKFIAAASGNATKTMVKKAIKSLYAISSDSNHEYDAIAICHVVKMFLEKKLDKKRMDYLEKKRICLK